MDWGTIFVSGGFILCTCELPCLGSSWVLDCELNTSLVLLFVIEIKSIQTSGWSSVRIKSQRLTRKWTERTKGSLTNARLTRFFESTSYCPHACLSAIFPYLERYKSLFVSYAVTVEEDGLVQDSH